MWLLLLFVFPVFIQRASLASEGGGPLRSKWSWTGGELCGSGLHARARCVVLPSAALLALDFKVTPSRSPVTVQPLGSARVRPTAVVARGTLGVADPHRRDRRMSRGCQSAALCSGASYIVARTWELCLLALPSSALWRLEHGSERLQHLKPSRRLSGAQLSHPVELRDTSPDVQMHHAYCWRRYFAAIERCM